MRLTLDELKNEDDTVVESNGIKIVYNEDIERYVQNSEIDYSDHFYNKGFYVKGTRTSSC